MFGFFNAPPWTDPRTQTQKKMRRDRSAFKLSTMRNFCITWFSSRLTSAPRHLFVDRQDDSVCCSFVFSEWRRSTSPRTDSANHRQHKHHVVSNSIQDTNGRVSLSVRSFVGLYPLCLSGASILWWDEPRCFIEI